jgi:hypothetical protein
VQLNLFIEKIKTLRVPFLACAKDVSQDARKAYSKRREAAEAIAAAERLLVSALGLDQLDFSQRLSYVRTFRDLLAEKRFDAEFFSPRHQAILQHLRRSGVTIGDVAPLAERPFHDSVKKRDGTFRYIEIGSLTGGGEAEAETIDLADAPSRAQFVVRPGDIITSTVRPIRRLSALIRSDQDGCVCSSGYAVLSPQDGNNRIEPEVLLTYLRLPVICEILDLYTTATMYPAIPTHHLLNIPVIIPEKRVRAKIVEYVRAAICARQEATRLLEGARTTVESAIVARSNR